MWSVNYVKLLSLLIVMIVVEMKTGINQCGIGLRCKHESCGYGC